MKAYTPKKILTRETKKALDKWDEKHEKEIDAIVLWTLHREFGFGEKRLKRLYNAVKREYAELRKRYSSGDDSVLWVCSAKLERLGIDLDEWEREE